MVAPLEAVQIRCPFRGNDATSNGHSGGIFESRILQELNSGTLRDGWSSVRNAGV